MRFAEPIWLEIGAIVTIVVTVLLVRSERRKAHALAALAAARIPGVTSSVPSRLRRALATIAAVLAVALSFVALARPQVGLRWETVQRKGTDLLLVVDTSRSMDADDVVPTRLERTKLAIHDLVRRFPEDRVGLVAFAGNAFVQSPMTLDHGALLANVDALDTSTVARGGTNIGRAIEVATDALETEPDHAKAIVIVSDGEQVEGDAVAAAKSAEAKGISIDTVGVGGTTGELVPAKDEHGKAIGVVRDEKGNAVRSKLDEKTLRAVADAGHGTYRALGDDGRGLERLYEQSLAPRARVESSERTRRIHEERFEIPLALALVAMMGHAVLALPIRRSTKTKRLGPAAAAATFALVLALPASAHASVGDAERAFRDGRFEAAHELYEVESKKRPDDARLAFGAGDAAYRAGRFEAAREAFDRALRAAKPELQQDVLYNQGNALFRIGEAHVKDDRAQTIARWKDAIAAYEGALALDVKDEDARHNLDLVKRRLAELEREEEKKDEQQQQQQQQQQSGEQQDQQKPQQSGEQQDRQQGGEQRHEQKGGSQEQKAKPQQQRGSQHPKEGRAGGGLSEDEARALLRAVKGEERAASMRGDRQDSAEEDRPKKDW